MSAWTVPSYAEGWTVPGYAEERRLGQGATGRVVAAVSEVTGQRVAIKYLSPALLRDPSFMWRYRTEAQTLRSLDVPQVVQLYDYVEEPGQGAAIVTELVDGISLHALVARGGPMSPESALTVLKGSLLALAAAHAIGIVHRDYKPENVLVDAHGNTKLADFGVAVKAGKKALVAGTPLYMAPEQWHGAPSSPSTDLYAAATVFFECLAGRPPFAGKPALLRQLHETAALPLDAVDPPLRALVARGMAKSPADRPHTAIAFVAELEATAAAVYGFDWEERGRAQLAERSAAVAPLLAQPGQAGAAGAAAGAGWLGLSSGGPHRRGERRRRVLTVAAISTAAVVAAAAVAAAVTLTGTGQPKLKSSDAATVTATFSAQAAVSPPVTASSCTTAAAFAFSGTLTASAPGDVSYRWVYSSGQPGPVRTVSFPGPGKLEVAGKRLTTRQSGSGWGEIKLVHPDGARASNRASYKLLCASSAGGIFAVAAVHPATQTMTCGTPPPSFTAAGSITSHRAGRVSYYWALANGRDSAPGSLTFSGPGTMAVAPLAITPAAPASGTPASGEAVLVVTSPAAAASSPAGYTVTCTAPKVTAAAAVSPAADTLTSCSAAAPAFAFTGTVSAGQGGAVSYYWRLPGGTTPVRTLHFGAAGTQAVTAASYRPATDTAGGSGTLVVTSPVAATSNAAAFTLACGQALSIKTNGAATATTGKAYSATATVAGGKGGYTWAVTGLPAGLKSAVAGGRVTVGGTPTKAGSYTIRLTATDGESPARSASASLALTVSAPALTLAGGTLTAATTATAYTHTVTASGGTAPYTWAATGLPAGLTIGAATGTISGTPTTAATSTINVTVTDSGAPKKTASATFTLAVTAPALTLAGGTLASGTSGLAYSAAVTAAGGSGTKTYSATGLPSGLTIGSATGTVSGTAPAVTKATSYTVTVKVTDTAAQTASGTYTITINPAAGATTSPSPTPTPTPTPTPKPTPTPTPTVTVTTSSPPATASGAPTTTATATKSGSPTAPASGSASPTSTVLA